MKTFFFIIGFSCCIISLQANPIKKHKILLTVFSFDTTLIQKKLLHKWQLIELHGKTIASKNGVTQTPYIIFDSTYSVSGFNGCNHFFGNYLLGKRYRIKFSSLRSTLMACSNDNSLEADVMQMIAKTDSYVLINDTLFFNKSSTASLASWVKMKTLTNTKKK